MADNAVSVFEPQAFEIGRVPLPVEVFLSLVPPSLVPHAFALSTGDIVSELSKVGNKRALIVGYINRRLSLVSGFYARKAYSAQDTLVFDGTLPEKEATAR